MSPDQTHARRQTRTDIKSLHITLNLSNKYILSTFKDPLSTLLSFLKRHGFLLLLDFEDGHAC